METKLFSWDGWDEVDCMAIMFYNCVLKVQIGNYPVGYTLPCISIDFNKGELSTWEDIEGKEIMHTFEISLTLGNEIQS